MVLQRQDRKMILKVDSIDPEKTKTPKKMNLGNTLFIGGVPESGVMLPPQLVIPVLSLFLEKSIYRKMYFQVYEIKIVH